MKATKKFFYEYRGIIGMIIIIIIFSVSWWATEHNFKADKTPDEIQKAKSVTVQISDGALITIKGYHLLDIDGNFKVNDSVWIELSDNCLPSSLRHHCDGYEKDGQGYAVTECCGDYPTDLIPGKVVVANNGL